MAKRPKRQLWDFEGPKLCLGADSQSLTGMALGHPFDNGCQEGGEGKSQVRLCVILLEISQNTLTYADLAARNALRLL